MVSRNSRPNSLGVPEADLRTSLEWLADVPLFSDDEQITALYDAVVRPEKREGTVTISLERLSGEAGKIHAKGGGEIGIASWIKNLLPFLDAKVVGEAGGEVSKTTSHTSGHTIELHPVASPYRQLIQLTLHYAAHLPHRVQLVLDPHKEGWCSDKFASALPRALLFVEFPPGTKFMPMAAEGDRGTVRPLYTGLAKKLGGAGDGPEYPIRGELSDNESYQIKEKEYWKWFSEKFNPYNAMAALEEGVKEGGRLRWVDYRVPLDCLSNPLHLHLSGREKFDTGVFAYNIVKRGYEHGLRIVGTLKSEPDINVLAIFDR